MSNTDTKGRICCHFLVIQKNGELFSNAPLLFDPNYNTTSSNIALKSQYKHQKNEWMHALAQSGLFLVDGGDITHPVKLLLISYNWYMKRFASLKLHMY